ncbi:MAG: hypothetical protein LBH05_03300 [Deferribacteraceae bacterium]|nr:hypothetical protein [Deferribacteraceae bacterium]
MDCLKFLPLPLVIFLFTLLNSCVSYYPYSVTFGSHEMTVIAQQSVSAAEFAQNLFDEYYYLSHIERKNSTTIINTDVPSVQFGQAVSAFRKYCSEKNGKTVSRYVPVDLPPVLTEGFAEQPVFYHHSPMGRTEFEWCVRDEKPLFAVAFTGAKGQGASGLYVTEQKDMLDYLDRQITAVKEISKKAGEVTALFRTDAVQEKEIFSVEHLELLLYTDKPQLHVQLTNNAGEEQTVKLDTPLGLLTGAERYLLTPDLRADSKISADISGEGCTRDQSGSSLLMSGGKKCSLLIRYVKNRDYRKIPVQKGALFFAGYTFAVTPVSESDTKDSKIWLKPKIDMQGR